MTDSRFRLQAIPFGLLALVSLVNSWPVSAEQLPESAEVVIESGLESTPPKNQAVGVPADHADKMKAGRELFRTEVRAILTTHCLECHGGGTVKADFNLTTRESLLGSGMVEVEGDAESSHFMAVLRHTVEPHMPQNGERLSDEALAAIARWLSLGAPYDRPLVEQDAEQLSATGPTEAERNFWSFQPLQVRSPPDVKDAGWTRTPIDQFVLARLEQENLSPNPIASRRVLIRRAYFDLIGLPPTPEEVQAFERDPDPRAYDNLIERLLDSPHYGERWARHWMDIARFAESHGYEQDYFRPHAYPYRDFLIRAFNDDLPYDQFIQWQIAGDELTRDSPLGLAATGFLGAGVFPTQLTEAEFESARYDELDDMLSTLGTAVLGTSIGCARCHDHKYDPIRSEEYYRLASVFTSTIRSEISLNWDPHAPDGAAPTLPELEEATGGEGSPSSREPIKIQVTSEGFPPTSHHADGRGYPHHYPNTYVLIRGDVHQKQDVAQPGYLSVLMRNGRELETWHVEPPQDWTRTSFRRAALANWLTDPEHGAGHLAARVIVNRLWHHHFGRGIVSTPSDFGFQGERPTHPELLDWLAVDLVQHGWKLKRLHRMIMTSAVYMQGGEIDADRAARDPSNILLWRRTPRRLEAEAIRDSMLAVSGLLDPTLYGPGSLDPDMRRRSIYFFIKRSQLIPMMMLFDWPEHLVGIGERSTTTIAPQALLMMNSPQTRQYAVGLAERLGDGTEEERIEQAYWIVLGRAPTAEEHRVAAQFLEQQTATYLTDHDSGARGLARVDLCQTLLSLNEFLYIE
jgi:mono/diheme cytochrome c family protein